MIHEFRQLLSVAAGVALLAVCSVAAADGFSWASAGDDRVRSLPPAAAALPRAPRSWPQAWSGSSRPPMTAAASGGPAFLSNPHVMAETRQLPPLLSGAGDNTGQLAAARHHEIQGEIQLAARQYEQALRVNPRDRQALISYARMRHRAGDMDGAIQLYRQSLVYFPQDPVAMNDLALCHARNGDLQFAIASLTTALQLQPDSKRYRNNLATILIEANRHDDALATLIEGHGDAIAYFNMGYLLESRGRHREAAEYLRAALAIDPSLTPASSLLAGLDMPADDRVARRPAAPVIQTVPDATTASPISNSERTAPVDTSIKLQGPGSPLVIRPQSAQLEADARSRTAFADYYENRALPQTEPGADLHTAPDPQSVSTPVIDALNQDGCSALKDAAWPNSP